MPTQPPPFRVDIVLPDPVTPDPATIRCKKCKVPLPDATWKNCYRCRKNRTDSFNRWKKSNQARKSLLDDSGPTFPSSSTTHPLSAPTSNPNPNPNPPSASRVVTKALNPGFSTFSQQAPSSLPAPAPPQQQRSQTTSDQPRTAPATLVAPQTIHVPEFQWSDELIDELAALPPRSRFLAKFSVIADPAVDNARRAQMFADQLRARGIPMSCVVVNHIFDVFMTSRPLVRLTLTTRSFGLGTGKISNRLRAT